MGSSDRTSTVTTNNTPQVPDNLKPFLNKVLNSTSGMNTDMTTNPVFKNIMQTALGQNLNQVNPYEQAQLNQNIDNSNNAIMRQFDASGRGNSFSNLQAVTGNTDNLTQGFMANNLNRNRQAMQNAQGIYFQQGNQSIQNQLNANQLLARLIQGLSGTSSTNTQTIPGNTWLQNLGGVLGIGKGLLGRGLLG